MPGVGERLAGKYLLTRRLGAGGMGEVYEAEHEHLGKRVAIKFLHPELAHDEVGAGRFKREARAAAATGHRSIVDIYDIGTTDDGALYLVMELLRGESLGQLLARSGPLDVETTVYVLAEVLSALHAAHAAGIVHRDIKPDNIFLVKTGKVLPEVKLLDFGASQMVDPVHPEDRLTRSGVVLGTPYYMSPEQAQGDKDMDRRVDVYAVGVILYEALTGVVPFMADNLLALVRRILEAPIVPPRELVPEIPEGLEAVILRAMARDRELRFATAEAMLDALMPFVEEGVKGQISRPPAATPLPAAAAIETEDTAAPWVESAPRGRARTGPESLDGVSTPRLRVRRGPARSVIVAAVAVAAVAAVVVVVGLTLWPAAEPGPEATAGVPPRVQPATADAGLAPGDRDATPPLPTPAAPARADAGPPVTIELLGVPDGAEVLLDGEHVEGTAIRRPRSDEARDVVVRLRDGREWRGEVSFERDREVEVELAPVRPVRGGGPGTKRAAPRPDAGGTAPQGQPDAGPALAPQGPRGGQGDPQLLEQFEPPTRGQR